MKSRRPRNPTASEILDMVPPDRRADVIARNPHLFGGGAAGAAAGSSPAGAMGVLVGAATAASTATTTASTSASSSPPAPPPLRRGRQPNKTEQRWLDELARDPTVKRVTFEGITLRLADGVRYTPDVFIEYADGGLGLDEVKGAYIRPDALMKLRVAVTQYGAFRWRLVQWVGRQWRIREDVRAAALGIGVSA